MTPKTFNGQAERPSDSVSHDSGSYRGPWRITFDTNPDDCNLHCIMCEDHSPYSTTQSDRREAGRPKRRMDIDLVRRVLAESEGTGLREIIPSTMGEPLLYRHFDEIIDLCAQYGVKLNLTTNGTFPQRGARLWAERIVPVASDVKISWNGSTKNTHESVMLGSNWDSVLENVREFIEVRDSHAHSGGNRCRVTFQLTFMEINIQELPDIVRLAAKLGVDRVKGHHLWVHFSQMRAQSMRRSPEAITRWNAVVDEGARDGGVAQTPLWQEGALGEYLQPRRGWRWRYFPWRRVPVSRTGGLGGLRRQVQPVLRSGRAATHPRRVRQSQRHEFARDLE